MDAPPPPPHTPPTTMHAPHHHTPPCHHACTPPPRMPPCHQTCPPTTTHAPPPCTPLPPCMPPMTMHAPPATTLTPPVNRMTDRQVWKHNLRKLRLRAVKTLRALADLMGASLAVQILSVSCSFWEILAKSYVGAPCWRPHLGEILDPPLTCKPGWNVPLTWPKSNNWLHEKEMGQQRWVVNNLKTIIDLSSYFITSRHESQL